MTIGNLQKGSELAESFRIIPAGWTPIEGSYVMCLGRDSSGVFGTFNDGDNVRVSQTEDFDTEELLRVFARTRGPSVMPAGTDWFAEIDIDGTMYAQRKITVGKTRDLLDMAVNVSHFSAGDHTLTFRLAFRDSLATGDSFVAEIPAFYLDLLNFASS